MAETSGLLFTDTIAFAACPKCGAEQEKDCISNLNKVSWTPHTERLRAFMLMPEYKPENYKRRLLFGTEVSALGEGKIPPR